VVLRQPLEGWLPFELQQVLILQPLVEWPPLVPLQQPLVVLLPLVGLQQQLALPTFLQQLVPQQPLVELLLLEVQH